MFLFGITSAKRMNELHDVADYLCIIYKEEILIKLHPRFFSK